LIVSVPKFWIAPPYVDDVVPSKNTFVIVATPPFAMTMGDVGVLKLENSIPFVLVLVMVNSAPGSTLMDEHPKLNGVKFASSFVSVPLINNVNGPTEAGTLMVKFWTH